MPSSSASSAATRFGSPPTGLRDVRDRRLAARPRDARAEDRAGTPHPIVAAGRVIERSQLARRASRGRAPSRGLRHRTSSGRCTVATSTTASRPPAGSSGRAAGRRGRPRRRRPGVPGAARPVADETGCTIDLDLRLVRDAYEIDPEHPLSLALRRGYADVDGHELPISGSSSWRTPRSSTATAGSPPSTTAPRERRPRRRRVRARHRARPRDHSLPAAARAPVGVSEAPRTYEELRRRIAGRSPSASTSVSRSPTGSAPRDPAILVTDGREITRVVSFGELSESSNRLANVLAAKGVARRRPGCADPLPAPRDGDRPRRDLQARRDRRAVERRVRHATRSRCDFVALSHERFWASGSRSSASPRSASTAC